MTVTLADVGEIISEINNAEISFRLENLVTIGFRWAVVGYEGNPQPGQMRLHRAEIDDAIQGALSYGGDMPGELKSAGLHDADFTVANANDQLLSQHVLKKDWLERGEADDIISAVSALALAICKQYPESTFTRWFAIRFDLANPV